MNNTLFLQWNIYRSENVQITATYHNTDECASTVLNKKKLNTKEWSE